MTTYIEEIVDSLRTAWDIAKESIGAPIKLTNIGLWELTIPYCITESNRGFIISETARGLLISLEPCYTDDSFATATVKFMSTESETGYVEHLVYGDCKTGLIVFFGKVNGAEKSPLSDLDRIIDAILTGDYLIENVGSGASLVNISIGVPVKYLDEGEVKRYKRIPELIKVGKYIVFVDEETDIALVYEEF